MLQPYLYWIIMGIILLIMEFFIPGFIIFFFGIGAIVTGVLAYLHIVNSFSVQLFVFLCTSILTLILLRKTLKTTFLGKNFDKSEKYSNIEIGREVEVVNNISPHKPGTVKYQGSLWSAKSETELKKGEIVKIKDYDGITLIVEKIKED